MRLCDHTILQCFLVLLRVELFSWWIIFKSTEFGIKVLEMGNLVKTRNGSRDSEMNSFSGLVCL